MSSVDRSPLLVENSVDTKVTRVFTNFENEKRQVLEPTTFGRHTVLHKEQPMGRRFDVRWSLVAQAIPENELFLSKMSIFRNREVVFSVPILGKSEFELRKGASNKSSRPANG